MNLPILGARFLWIALAVAFATHPIGLWAQAAAETESTLPNCKDIARTANYSKGLVGAWGNATPKVDYWAKHPFTRGKDLEKMLGADEIMQKNFRAIDAYKNGVATSIKTIDLTGDTYKNESYLRTPLMNYLKELQDWKGGVADGKMFPPPGEKITKRVLKVGVRSCNKVSPMQQKVFEEVIEHAKTLKIVVEIVAL